jgi:imidazoleglycerol-phosphate dehydratase
MRSTTIERTTKETSIKLSLSLDGQGRHDIASGVPFLDHMLTHVAVHGLFDLAIHACGDTAVDDHHTVEDVGIVMGQALDRALGDRSGIHRYGDVLIPMDEALALVAVDVSGRGLLGWDVSFPAERVGSFATELVQEFLLALAREGHLTIHVRMLAGRNAHHMAEAIFKALGRALREAVDMDERRSGIPSTKGSIS